MAMDYIYVVFVSPKWLSCLK